MKDVYQQLHVTERQRIEHWKPAKVAVGEMARIFNDIGLRSFVREISPKLSCKLGMRKMFGYTSQL